MYQNRNPEYQLNPTFSLIVQEYKTINAESKKNEKYFYTFSFQPIETSPFQPSFFPL